MPRRPGPKPIINRAVVLRVASAVARGVPLEISLANASRRGAISVETWQKAMKSHPEFDTLYARAKSEFLEKATGRLARNRDWRAIAWLLERRHSALFAPPKQDVNVSGSLLGMREEVVKGIQDRALERAHAVPIINGSTDSTNGNGANHH